MPAVAFPAARTSLAAALGLVAMVAVACVDGSDAPAASPAPGEAARFGVGFRGETFADPDQPGRSLTTTIYYPAATEEPEAVEGAAPLVDRGPFPLVLFSHGGGTTGRSYSNLLSRVVEAGYVVAAPNYRGQPEDPQVRPADARLVITAVLAAAGEPTSPLRALVDPGRVAAMGHSMGGGITLGFAFNSCCLDARVRAAVLLASARPSYPGEAFPAPGVPALVVHGDADTRAAYADGRRLYEELRAPKYLLTIHGGEHTPPFSGATQRSDARVVVDSVVAFLDRYLNDDAGATDRLVGTAAAEPLVATLERA